MNPRLYSRRWILTTAAMCTLALAGLALMNFATGNLRAESLLDRFQGHSSSCNGKFQCDVGQPACGEDEFAGAWYWLRSPEEEKRVTMGLYNRYCIRCHAADGRGVWDIPGVPNFTNVAWQASRTDPQIVRIILEGRGAVMPQFRGTLTLEEACAMARYLRTFVPGTETPRPILDGPAKPADAPAPMKLPEAPGPMKPPEAPGPVKPPEVQGPMKLPDAPGPMKPPEATGPMKVGSVIK